MEQERSNHLASRVDAAGIMIAERNGKRVQLIFHDWAHAFEDEGEDHRLRIVDTSGPWAWGYSHALIDSATGERLLEDGGEGYFEFEEFWGIVNERRAICRWQNGWERKRDLARLQRRARQRRDRGYSYSPDHLDIYDRAFGAIQNIHPGLEL